MPIKQKKSNFRHYLKASFRDLYEFYTPPQRRKNAESVPRLFRFVYKSFWFFNGVTKKLQVSRYRWILIIISLILFFNQNGTSNNNLLAYFILFFVLLLEIRDKLLAHEELQAGSAIQNALMPPEHPGIPGWDVWLKSKPARMVGGDYLDVHAIDEKCCGVAIGDVSGKGLGAALLMAKLQASTEALISHTRSLPEMTAQLNNLFCTPRLRNQFISFMYIDISDDILSFVNAGHLPPWIIRNKQLVEMTKGGVALGLVRNQTYELQTTELKSGDVFIAVTDGCTEVRDEDGRFIDEAVLRQELVNVSGSSARQIGEHLLQTILDFSIGAVQHDDLTLMILKRK